MKQFDEDDDAFYEDPERDDPSGIVRKFEDMLGLSTPSYFDVDEFLTILDFYLQAGRPEMAGKVMGIAVNQHPHSQELLIKQPQILLEQKKTSEALRNLKNLEEMFGGSYEIFLLRGMAFIQMGNYKEANHQFRKSLSVAPEEEKVDLINSISSQFISELEFRLAIRYLLKSYRLNPANETNLFEIAYCYEKLERHEQSILFYEKCLDLNPFSDQVWFNLGIIYNLQENFEKAVECYDFALAVNPSYHGAYLNKANTLVNHGRFDEARSVYLELLEIEEDNEYAHFYLGECYEKSGDFDQAAAWYHKTLEIDEDFADAWHGLAIIKSNEGDHPTSLDFIERAIRLDDSNPDYWFTYAKIQLNLQNRLLAITGFWRATEADPYDFEAWLELADVLFRDKRIQEAIQLLEYALEFDRHNPGFLYRLAAYSFLARKNRKGYEWLEKGLKEAPDQLPEFFDLFPKAMAIRGVMQMAARYGWKPSQD